MDLAIRITVSVLAAGVFFFIIRTYGSIMARNKLSKLELHQLEIEEAYENREKITYKQRLNNYAIKHGYRGSPVPILLALLFVYLALALGLRLMGMSQVMAAILATPVTLFAVFIAFSSLARARRKAFSRQLLDALRLMANSLESGKGVNQALEQAVGASDAPFSIEMGQALSANLASKDLIASLEPVGKKYPSKAWNLFISALEVDKSIGESLAPALRQAAELLQEEFALQAKAQTLLASNKMAFNGVVAITGIVSWIMVKNMGEMATAAYKYPISILIMSIVGLNFAVGVFRALKIFNTAGGKF